MAGRPLPAALVALTRGATWRPVTIGMSGVQTYRLEKEGRTARYLKWSPNYLGRPLAPERDRLVWLAGRLPVPEVLHFSEEEDGDYLLLSEVPGRMACDPALDPARVVVLLAEGLRMIHAVPVADCPFDQRLAVTVEQARRHVLTRKVDEAAFDEPRRGRTAQEVFQEVLKTQPAGEDLVFTHGDYCLPNVLLDHERWRIGGFIDWDRGGVADRYQDLALAARSLTHNFDARWVPQLLEAYGLGHVDQEKAAFYQLLDELF
jgi:aminoglycoside phosphotransferase